MTEEEKVAEQRKALDWWYEGFKSGDIAHAYTGFHDDCTWSGVGKNLERVTYTGKQRIIDYQAAWVHDVWTGTMTYFPIHTLCADDVLMAEWEDEAISRETGEKYTNKGIFVWEFEGTKVKRGRAWFDAGPLAKKEHVGVFAEKNVAEG